MPTCASVGEGIGTLPVRSKAPAAGPWELLLGEVTPPVPFAPVAASCELCKVSDPRPSSETRKGDTSLISVFLDILITSVALDALDALLIREVLDRGELPPTSEAAFLGDLSPLSSGSASEVFSMCLVTSLASLCMRSFVLACTRVKVCRPRNIFCTNFSMSLWLLFISYHMQFMSKLLALPPRRMQPSQNSSISTSPEPSLSRRRKSETVSDAFNSRASKYSCSFKESSFKKLSISSRVMVPELSTSMFLKISFKCCTLIRSLISFSCTNRSL
mmetsp:Transcript_2976/g.6548  ORF Transcript_2976/g.6548 Transcript_2976/m.6548 type:complete len:274 (-) Transcript_2976:88-909(-)